MSEDVNPPLGRCYRIPHDQVDETLPVNKSQTLVLPVGQTIMVDPVRHLSIEATLLLPNSLKENGRDPLRFLLERRLLERGLLERGDRSASRLAPARARR